jgi:hypothetical protein
VFDNIVGKSMMVSGNTGLLDVVNNLVEEILTCQANTNLVMGGGNTARNMYGQCN